MGGVLRKGAARGFRILQSRAAYRAVGRWVLGEIGTTTATPSDLAYVQSKLPPGLSFEPPSGPLVTHLVARRNGHVIGFVELVRRPPDQPSAGFWLHSLYVPDPAYRGLGIGEAMVRSVIGIARAEGAGELWLGVGENNLPAVRLYRKLGFERPAPPNPDAEPGAAGPRSIVMVKRLHE